MNLIDIMVDRVTATIPFMPELAATILVWGMVLIFGGLTLIEIVAPFVWALTEPVRDWWDARVMKRSYTGRG